MSLMGGNASHPRINPCMGKRINYHGNSAFFSSSDVIGVSYQPGFRGGIIERMISLSSEVSKPSDTEICDRGDVAGWTTALGFSVPGDPTTGWYFWEMEQRLDRENRDWSFMDARQLIVDEISRLYGYDGKPLRYSTAGGSKLSFISHWDVGMLRQLWPNARYVVPHWFGGYRWLRDVYSKVHSKVLHKAETDDMEAISRMHGIDVSGIRTIIEYHTWKWSGFSRYDRSSIKEYMHREIGRINAKQSLNLMQRDVHTVDMRLLFDRQAWHEEYDRLCGFCGIRPEFGLCEELVRNYNDRQWAR